MDPLIEKCVVFIAEHLPEVAAIPVDLSCLAEPLLLDLAARCSEEALEAVRAFAGRPGEASEASTQSVGASDDTEAEASSNARQMLVIYSDEKVANRDIRVWHGATENGP
jgi:hypothetical protein